MENKTTMQQLFIELEKLGEIYSEPFKQHWVEKEKQTMECCFNAGKYNQYDRHGLNFETHYKQFNK